MLGTPGFIQKKRSRFLFWKFDFGNESNLDIDKILLACNNLSEKKTGALIIITNKSGLEQYVNTGDIIDANVSNGLIENIFTKSNGF